MTLFFQVPSFYEPNTSRTVSLNSLEPIYNSNVASDYGYVFNVNTPLFFLLKYSALLNSLARSQVLEFVGLQSFLQKTIGSFCSTMLNYSVLRPLDEAHFSPDYDNPSSTIKLLQQRSKIILKNKKSDQKNKLLQQR